MQDLCYSFSNYFFHFVCFFIMLCITFYPFYVLDLWKPISAKTRYILQWMKCVSREKRCIFQVQRCIFQLERCIIPIWRPPDISGGRQLENEMYISSGNVYFNWRDVYFKYISPVEINIFHLKYTSHSVSGGRQIYLAAAT